MNKNGIFNSWPIRKKLILLLLIGFLPALGIITTNGIKQRHEEINISRKNALLVAESLAGRQEQIAVTTKTMLSTLAKLREVQSLNSRKCNRLFRTLNSQYPFYTIILAATLDGNIFSSSVRFKAGSVNIADRKYFKDAVRMLNLSVGEYSTGRISNAPSIHYALPVFNEKKKLVAVVAAGFNLSEYYRFLSKAGLPEGSSVSITDWKGVRLFRLPKNEQAIPGTPIPRDTFAHISSSSESGYFENNAPDGSVRISAYRQLRLHKRSPPYMYIIVHIDKDKLLNRADLQMFWSLLLLGVTAVFAVSLAWFYGNLAFIRPIKRLVTATQRFGGGEMDTRTGLPHTSDELGQLARSFDEMASLMEAKNIEREKAEEALKDAEAKYRSIFENAVEGISQTTPEGRHINVNPAYAKMMGYDTPEELLKGVTDISKQLYVDPEDRVRLKETLAEQGIILGFETRHYRKDGSIIWISINSRTVRDQAGAVLYYEGTIEDITARKAVQEEFKQHAEKLRKSLIGTIRALSLTVETRDPYTAGHQRRVSRLARTIAQDMALHDDTVDSIRLAGVIHDIGKISVPAEILSKPGILTNIEMDLIKVHPQSGYEILKDAELPYPIAEIVLQHHERLDGSGYPQGLKDDQILLESRILAVADIVEAIASHRPYRPAHGIDAALEAIEKNSGLLYDTVVVQACLRLFREKEFRFE